MGVCLQPGGKIRIWLAGATAQIQRPLKEVPKQTLRPQRLCGEFPGRGMKLPQPVNAPRGRVGLQSARG